tara:strand:+ start:778 stop:1140 length:363 start_codon:yes stop_codon:yes gene_type:complete
MIPYSVIKTVKAEALQNRKAKRYSAKDIPDEIIYDCAEAAGVSLGQMMGKGREQRVVEARWMCYRILYPMGFSLSVIGARFNRDHGTVLHGLKTIQQRLDTNDRLMRPIVKAIKMKGYKI